MANKYPGLDPRDTTWDKFHRERGEMTNHEFFTSNGPGGFYEGMEWDESKEEWIPNLASRRREQEEKEKWFCFGCQQHKDFCECETSNNISNDNDW